jgi:hypothetical protein
MNNKKSIFETTREKQRHHVSTMVIGFLPAKEGAKYIIYRVMVNWSQGCRTGFTRGFWNLHQATGFDTYLMLSYVIYPMTSRNKLITIVLLVYE